MPGPAETLEWWPDYDGALIWRGAERVSMSELGISVGLRGELTTWLSEYEDDLLFGETAHSASWIAKGTRLLRALQDELRGSYTVEPSENYWLAGDA